MGNGKTKERQADNKRCREGEKGRKREEDIGT